MAQVVAGLAAKVNAPGAGAFRCRVLYEGVMFGGLGRGLSLSALVLIASWQLAACKRDADPRGSAPPRAKELPALVVKPDTPNLLITWIDEQGDFHVVQKPTEVPAPARGKVRIVVADKEPGTGESIYVTNLNESAPDGSYRLATLSRAAWDELGASRRSARLEALAPSSASPPLAPSAGPPAAGPGKGAPASGVQAIVYGADWCKPCHDAERYLRQRGATVVKKDIEESEAAAAEMKRKLDRAGLGGASIPVIDVMGRILVGFSPASVDGALEAAKSSKPL
jgi:glutaredoxin